MGHFRSALVIVLTLAAAGIAADAPAEAPKSPAAVAAARKHAASSSAARAAYLKALVEADGLLVTDLDAALATAMANKELPEANRINAAKVAAVAAQKAHQAEQRGHATAPAGGAPGAAGAGPSSIAVASAFWGDGRHDADVTKAVAERLARGDAIWADNNLTDSKRDPAGGAPKRLTIRLVVGGTPVAIDVPEAQRVTIHKPSDDH